MLVLARKKNEEIVLGNGLAAIHVVEIRGDKVRIGIDAPREFPIHRREVFDVISREHGSQVPYVAVPLPVETLTELIERANQQGVSVEHLASLLIAGALKFRLNGNPGVLELDIESLGDDANHAGA